MKIPHWDNCHPESCLPPPPKSFSVCLHDSVLSCLLACLLTSSPTVRALRTLLVLRSRVLWIISWRTLLALFRQNYEKGDTFAFAGVSNLFEKKLMDFDLKITLSEILRTFTKQTP